MAQVAWHDWLPTVWLDEHQMGAGGPRIFVMPATDPINPERPPAHLPVERRAWPVAGGRTGSSG